MKQFLAPTCWSRGLIIMRGVSFLGIACDHAEYLGCKYAGVPNGAGRRGFSCGTSTLDSPLSVAKIYNNFGTLSRPFVKFYVFDKGKSIASGKIYKEGGPRGGGIVLVLSLLS